MVQARLLMIGMKVYKWTTRGYNDPCCTELELKISGWTHV
jgi:hypothetical protein